VKELVVISGKGGTGKTSVVASFAALAEKPVLADCDVDAADLHLVLEPTIQQRAEFSGGSQARIVAEQCTGCGRCLEVCRFDAIKSDGTGLQVDPIACEGCGVCAHFCPAKAIEFGPVVNGEWFISETRFGPMVHAKLGIAQSNSGKLVSLIRVEARKLAEADKREMILVDGSPGIGCPVIASITGASMVLIVTEPTLSGLHDMERVMKLTRHFQIPAAVCVNKWDLNEAVSDEIAVRSQDAGLRMVGNVRYDRQVTQAQIAKQPLVEFSREGAAADVSRVWTNVFEMLSK
jgi:MinD superfamily P-loop ATPase